MTERLSDDWQAYIDIDMPPVGAITKQIVTDTIEHSRLVRGSVRLSIGRFWTDEDLDNYRKKVYSTPLP